MDTSNAGVASISFCSASARIVFVGGPTNYKPLRDAVCRALELPADTTVNPMTAVAEGAAIFASELGDADLMRALAPVLAKSGTVLQRFSKFGSAANRTPDFDSDQVKEWFAAHYGKTYWYYYLFVDVNINR